jgi:hypothetical protein
VTFTAAASGGTGAYEYQFTLSDGTTTTTVQPWGAGASWALPATQPVGNYTVAVSVRTNATATTPDATASVAYAITWQPATGVVLAASLASPQLVGTAVTFTAAPTGGTGGYSYQFSVNAGAGNTVVQPWTPTATYALPTTLAAGNYTVTVDVSTNGGTTIDATSTIPYTLDNVPATGVTLTPSLASPQIFGTAVTFTAAGAGGTGAYQYQFDLSDGTTTTTVQAWSATATWTLPATQPVGSYTVTVSVRTNATAATPDATASASYAITYAPVTATLTPSLASPQLAGTAVTFTAAATGGPGGYQYRFSLTAGATTTVVQPFGVTTTYTFPATQAAGSYTVTVDVSTDGGATVSGTASVAYVLTNAPATGVNVAATPSSGLTPETWTVASLATTPVTFTASGVGGTGAYEYQFDVTDTTTLVTTTVQAWSATSAWSIPAPPANAAGSYQLTVSVRTNPGGAADAQATMAFVLQ